MKRLLLSIAILAATLTAPAAEIPQPAVRTPQSERTPYYKTVPGWKRLWAPVVRWNECPVTPAKLRADKLRGYGPFHQDVANQAGRL